jgi:hypothetical protein
VKLTTEPLGARTQRTALYIKMCCCFINNVLRESKFLLFHEWQEEFTDTKAVIRIPTSKKDRQQGQTKSDKRAYNDLQNITKETKELQHEPH